MRKLLLLCTMLLSGIGAWADFEQQYGNNTPWLKEGFVAPVQARGENWSIGMTQTSVVVSGNTVTVTFDWNGNSDGKSTCGLNILGVDLIDPETYEVIANEYKTGKDSWSSRPVYTLNNVENGNYILRYFVEEDGNGDALSKTGGRVIVSGADFGYTKPLAGFYRIKGQNTTKPYLSSTTKNGADLQVVATAEEAGTYYVETSEDKVYLLNYETGKYFYQSSCFTLGDTKEPVEFELDPDRTYNNVGDMPRYRIKISGIYMFNNNTDGIVHQSGTPNAVAEKFFTFEPVYQLPITIGNACYSTLFSPVVLTLPEGVDAYYVSSMTSSYVSMTKIENGVVPSNTAVILKGEAKPYKLSVSGCPSQIDSNKLAGTIADTYVPGPAYVLSAPNGKVGLYKAELNKGANGGTGTTHFKNNAGKAYLPASEVTSNSRFFLFDFGGNETGIEEIETGDVETVKNAVYDLSGRRVQKAERGLFIVNGKKVVF